MWEGERVIHPLELGSQRDDDFNAILQGLFLQMFLFCVMFMWF